MKWLRLICLPAIVAGLLTPVVLGLWGGHAISSIIEGPLAYWIRSGLGFGLAYSLAYVLVAIPMAKLFKPYGRAVTSVCLLLVAALVGFILPWVILLGPLLGGADAKGFMILGLIGATMGLLGAATWLPFNSELLRRSCRSELDPALR